MAHIHTSSSDSAAKTTSSAPLRAGSHTAHFFSTESQLFSEVGQRLYATLVAGGAAVIIADGPHRRGFADYLESHGIDLSRVTNQGRWLALDASKTLAEFMVGEFPDPGRFFTLIGGILDRLTSAVVLHGSARAPIIAYGEMVAVLWEEGNQRASLRLEKLWNELGNARAFHLSCGWPLRFFSTPSDALAVDQICAEHTQISPTLGVSNPPETERRIGGFLWQLKARNVLEHVSQISRQTLGFYRDSAAPVWISVPEAINEVLAIFNIRLAQRDIEVRTNIRPDVRVRSERGDFKHILSNLFANALDASSPGSTIYVAARESRHSVTGVRGLRLLVGDQGIGIPPGVASKVFTPFFAARKDINIGLGLWTVRDLLEKRGGSIRCRSRVARPSGTMMMAFLPTEPIAVAA
jgi:hypothetical protein